jgi:primary-amine oxidase
LWKHINWRTNYTEARRSRRLVVSFIATVDNYEYGFYWYFYQDGQLQFEVKLTGVISNGAADRVSGPGGASWWRRRCTRRSTSTSSTCGFDMMVDGPNKLRLRSQHRCPTTPHHNAFHTEATLLATESQAQRIINPLSGRFWSITNPSSINRLGQPVSYKLMPGENVLPFAGEDASVLKRAAFTTRHLWVTPYQPRERYAAGDYPNQHPGGAGLPEYTRGDRPITDTDVVVWDTFGGTTWCDPRTGRSCRCRRSVFHSSRSASSIATQDWMCRRPFTPTGYVMTHRMGTKPGSA